MALAELNDDKGLARLDDLEPGLHRVEASAVAILNRSEIETQIDAAHRHPRSIRRFLKEAETLATLTEETAQACIYALPRGDTVIRGESVRLAEICASAYGNMHAGGRVVGVEDKEVVAQGIAWDIEKNYRVTLEARRKITGRNGRRFNDDMINMTGNAAVSIAFRNAIFRAIPKAYVRQVYEAARKVAVGDAKTLGDRRGNALRYFATLGVTVDRVLVRVGKPSVEDVGLDDLELLLGLMNAIRQNEVTPEEAFPVVVKVAAAGGLEAAAKADPKPSNEVAKQEAPSVQNARPWAAEAEVLKAEAQDVVSSKDKAKHQAFANKAALWCAEAPADLAQEFTRFWSMIAGEKPKKREREPGEEG